MLNRLHLQVPRDALRGLWETLESMRPQIDAAVEQAAREVPQFLALLEQLPPSVRAEEAERSRALERGALVDGDWAPYMANLRTQGETYARMGIPFGAWFRLVTVFRSVVAEAPTPGGAAPHPDAARAMDAFLSIAMGTIGEAYLATKEELVRATREQLDHYVGLAQSSPVGMAVWRWNVPGDPSSFRLVIANPAARALLPEAEAAQEGASPQPMPAWATEIDLANLMIDALTDGEPRSWSLTRRAPEAGRIHFAGQCFPLHANFVGMMFEDVTERVAMREELRARVEELERSNRDLDDFAYVASHDLRAPLQDIRTLAAWVAEDARGALPLEAALHLDRLAGRVGRMERLLEDLLDYSRVGRGAAPPIDLSLAEVVEAVVAFLRPPPGFVVVTRRSPRFVLPRTPLEQVLRNLVLNAIKHHDRAEGSVTVDGEIANGRLRIEVTDDGPGIPPAYHERVFRIFQTLKPRDEVEGSGMGLAIVKKVVEAAGGTVGIRSEGRGTTMQVEWPLAADPERAAP